MSRAPDAASASAAESVAVLARWRELGQNQEACWGLFQGAAMYRVLIDRADGRGDCSCPSRKQPCKHLLGLMLLSVDNPQGIPNDEPPDWVADRIDRLRSTKSAAPAAGPAKAPPGERARQRRQEQREGRILSGLDRFELWLHDLVREGLAGLERRPRDLWEHEARRLVDAQSPGLASRVARLADLFASGPDWPDRLLAELGRLQLVVRAYRRQQELPPDLRFDLRQQLGWTVSARELEAIGEPVEDDWLVFGQLHSEEDRLRVQRSWCSGARTGRTALILQFAPGTSPFGETITPGTLQPGRLRFYPGSYPLRARIEQHSGPVRQLQQRLPGDDTIASFLDRQARALACNPWLGRIGCVLRDVTLTVQQGRGLVRDREGAALWLAGQEIWLGLALTGGNRFDLCGEWDGRSLRLLGLVIDGRYWPSGI